ncbi:MAG: TlpA family protein disulfide reductase [Flavobacteriaceae bacterium]|nr:TlpA family protein disulfide reductase [Flavobacteriaceae bacterium]
MKRIALLLSCLAIISCKKDPKKETVVVKEFKKGTYRAALTVQDNKELPFLFELDEHNKITVLNAEERIEVTDIEVRNDSVFIKMPVFDAVIQASLDEMSNLKGVYMKGPKNLKVPFVAMHDIYFRYPKFTTTHNPIAGKWEVTFSPGTENEYKAVGVFKDGKDNMISGTFLTETGDYRFLEGALDDGLFKLSCFDGSHAFLFDAVVKEDSIVSGNFYSGNHYKEPWVAIKNDKFELTNPEELTYLKKGYDKVEFSFPDLEGNMISLEDDRFKGKATIIQIMGSWCPNCLDESKYLTKFYQANKDKDIQIIALAFENAKTHEKAVANLKRFKNRLGIGYDILVAQVGSSSKLKAGEKLPMLNHILSYPTTIYIDKKGKVRKIHTGFNGPATGEKYTEFTTEFESFVAELAGE